MDVQSHRLVDPESAEACTIVVGIVHPERSWVSNRAGSHLTEYHIGTAGIGNDLMVVRT